jgi:hypothetical protein
MFKEESYSEVYEKEAYIVSKDSDRILQHSLMNPKIFGVEFYQGFHQEIYQQI